MKKHNGKNRRKYKHTKKMLGVPVVLLAGAAVATAAILGFFFTSMTSITTDPLFEIDSYDAEEYEITQTITNAVGGNSYSFNHWLNASSHIQENVTLTFTWSGNSSEDGVTPSLWYDGSEISTLVLEPNVDYMITEKFDLDPMITSETYVCVLTVDVS
jgi:hypothetical protein